MPLGATQKATRVLDGKPFDLPSRSRRDPSDSSAHSKNTDLSDKTVLTAAIGSVANVLYHDYLDLQNFLWADLFRFEVSTGYTSPKIVQPKPTRPEQPHKGCSFWFLKGIENSDAMCYNGNSERCYRWNFDYLREKEGAIP